MSKENVVVIGGGAAGVMAAISASQLGKKVVLIEKNSQIGKKLAITGGGRCNVTNDCDPSQIISKTIRNGKFLYHALHHFTSKDMMKLLERKGVALKVEEGGKVFPKSNQSKDIIEAFLNILEENRVEVILSGKVDRIIMRDNQVKGVELSNGKRIEACSVIVATGGVSYPHTGSTGEGHELAKEAGHTVTLMKPSLVPLVLQEGWIRELMGISLPNVKITYKINKNKKIQSSGPFLFTHYGISGPAVLELSAHLNEHIVDQGKLKLQIDLLPHYSSDELEKAFVEGSQAEKGQTIKTLLTEWLPKNLVTKLLDRVEVDGDTRLQHVTKKEKLKLMEHLKGLEVNVIGTRSIKEGIVTSGGVHIKEVNPKTMESKQVKGLFFAGEVLDIDALTGGYNLQIAFSTGYIAGQNA